MLMEADLPPAEWASITPADLPGDCECGRGRTIGSASWTSTRMNFRAFHEGPAAYHLMYAGRHVCVDCVSDIALAVATGEVRDRRRALAAERAAQPA